MPGDPRIESPRSIGGLLGHERSPESLRRAGRRQLRKLPSVDVVEAEVLDLARDGDGAALTVACPQGVTRVRVRAVLLANGLRYDPPDIPGLAPLWGRSVFHCVFCDGWEVSDKPIALHAREAGAARLALLTRAWSSDLVLCTDETRGHHRRRARAARGRRDPHPRGEDRPPRLPAQEADANRLRGGAARSARRAVHPTGAKPAARPRRARGLELDAQGLIVADTSGRTAVARGLRSGRRGGGRALCRGRDRQRRTGSDRDGGRPDRRRSGAPGRRSRLIRPLEGRVHRLDGVDFQAASSLTRMNRPWCPRRPCTRMRAAL